VEVPGDQSAAASARHAATIVHSIRSLAISVDENEMGVRCACKEQRMMLRDVA